MYRRQTGFRHWRTARFRNSARAWARALRGAENPRGVKCDVDTAKPAAFELTLEQRRARQLDSRLEFARLMLETRSKYKPGDAKGEGQAVLKNLIAEFPDSAQAAKAKEMLEKCPPITRK